MVFEVYFQKAFIYFSAMKKFSFHLIIASLDVRKIYYTNIFSHNFIPKKYFGFSFYGVLHLHIIFVCSFLEVSFEIVLVPHNYIQLNFVFLLWLIVYVLSQRDLYRTTCIKGLTWFSIHNYIELILKLIIT